MTCKISGHGILSITPENELESFALQKWFESYNSNQGDCDLRIESVYGVEEIMESVKPMVKVKPETVKKTPEPKAEKTVHLPETNTIDLAVLNVIDGLTEGLPVASIADILDCKPYEVGNALQRLLKKDLVVKDEDHKPQMWKFKKRPPKNLNQQIDISDTERVDFARELGYKNIDEALKDMGSWKFEQQLKEFLK